MSQAETPAMAPDSVKPARGLQPQSDWRSLLQPCPSGKYGGSVFSNQRSERVRQPIQAKAQNIQSFAKLQHETGIDSILAGGSPMDESSRAFALLRHLVCESLHDGDSEVAGLGRSLNQLVDLV